MTDYTRITPAMSTPEILETLRNTRGYFLTLNERDVSQSDFKCRIMPYTTLKVAPYRNESGFFAFEASGGACVHVDLMRKQINPFEKLRLVRKAMPDVLLQVLCRGRNLFGYRPYPENVIRETVRLFSRYVDVWRVYDFLNHVPNLMVIADEVKKQGKLLMPCICFSTGKEHTNDYYVSKVEEIISAMGEDIVLCIKNHSAVGTPERISELVTAIHRRFPDLLLAYHGHNTDGGDLGRMVAATMEGVKIIEVADHGLGGIYSQAPALSLVQILGDYGLKAPGLNVQSLVDASDTLRRERRLYEQYESHYRGFDPTVKRHKLTGGAASMSFEQVERLGLMERMHEVFGELAAVNEDLGNIWSVTPGSQILWTTAVNNVIHGRYENPSDDLKRLLLGRYGPFPFYQPEDWIYKKVLEHHRTDGRTWKQVLEEDGGILTMQDEDFDERRRQLSSKLGRPATDEEVCLYVQFPRDTVEYLTFEERFGKAWLLPPDVWFRRKGFEDGSRITFSDLDGKTHHIDVVSTRRSGDAVHTSLLVDYHFQTHTITVPPKNKPKP